MILKPDILTGYISLWRPNRRIPDILPGILQSISINGEIIVDSSQSVGDKTPSKTSRGFRDKTVSISLLILPTPIESIYMQLERLEQLFHSVNKKEPEVFMFSHKHISARGIRNMLFQSFSSAESGSENAIRVSLNFEEFNGAGKVDEDLEAVNPEEAPKEAAP